MRVQPAFEEMVKQGLFAKRLIGLYQRDKGLALRHVGFLGAQPPEIKGLADVQFSERRGIVIEVPIGTSFVCTEAQSRVSNSGRVCANTDSARLSEAAHRLASEESITFAEALTRINSEQPELTRYSRAGTRRARDFGSLLIRTPCDFLSWQNSVLETRASRSPRRLSEIAKEHPELAVRGIGR